MFLEHVCKKWLRWARDARPILRRVRSPSSFVFAVLSRDTLLIMSSELTRFSVAGRRERAWRRHTIPLEQNCSANATSLKKTPACRSAEYQWWKLEGAVSYSYSPSPGRNAYRTNMFGEWIPVKYLPNQITCVIEFLYTNVHNPTKNRLSIIWIYPFGYKKNCLNRHPHHSPRKILSLPTTLVQVLDRSFEWTPSCYMN